jgi:hypothetical protein
MRLGFEVVAASKPSESTFDVLLVVISVFLGALAGLAANALTRERQSYLQEEAAINNLIFELASKRALAVEPGVKWAPGSRKRTVVSIIHTRALLSDARRELRPRSEFFAHIQSMIVACNTFLEQSEFRKGGPLEAHQLRLSTRLREAAWQLHQLRPERISFTPPGSAVGRSDVLRY